MTDNKPTRTFYSDQKVAELFELLGKSPMSVETIREKYGVSTNTVYVWLRRVNRLETIYRGMDGLWRREALIKGAL